VEVFEFPGPEITDFCQLEGKALVATGTASFSAPALFTPGGVETGTWVVRGTVDLVSGGQDRLFGKAQLVVRPDGSLVLEKEHLTLTPDRPAAKRLALRFGIRTQVGNRRR